MRKLKEDVRSASTCMVDDQSHRMNRAQVLAWAGADETEERALARAMMAVQDVPGSNPPNNKAFETDLFLYVRDAYALMTKIGLFGGLPRRLPYPSREQALALAGSIGATVLQRMPNNASVSVTLPAEVTQER